MAIILSFLVGALLGTCIVYWVSQKTIGAQRKQLEQNHRLMGELEQSHEIEMRDNLESLRRKHQKELDEQRNPLETEIDGLHQKNQEELNDLAQDHWNTLEAFQTERYLEITNLKKEHQSEIASLNAQNAELKQKFQTDMKTIQQKFQKKLETEVESARAQFQVVVDKFINDHKVEIEQLKQQHQQEINALTVKMNGSGETLTNGQTPNAPNTDQSTPPEHALETDELPVALGSPSPAEAFPVPAPSIPEPSKQARVAEADIPPEPNPFIATVEMLGRAKRVSAIGQLSKQMAQADAEGRQAIAQAFFQIIRANPQSPALQRAIPSLNKLSQDVKPAIRRKAIEALGLIPSAKAVPIVKRALRDPDSKVIKVANQAMEKLKPFSKLPQHQRFVSSSFS